MKIVCINNNGWKDYLTIGKTYEVIKENNTCYFLINDIGCEYWYEKIWLKPAVAEMRNDTINKLLEDES